MELTSAPEEGRGQTFPAEGEGAVTFDQAVAACSATVTRVCLVHLNNPSDAEDCWQNTFLALFENQKVLRRGPEAVKRWLIRWDALNTVDETALLAAAEKVHYEQTPHSVSDDPDYPNYGTFTISGYVLFEDSVEEELRRELDVQIEFYADHFTHDGDRYDEPVYTVIGTDDPGKSGGKYVYTYIDVDCGDGVHFTVATYSKTPDQLGFCVGRADLETTRAMALGNAIPYVAYRA